MSADPSPGQNALALADVRRLAQDSVRECVASAAADPRLLASAAAAGADTVIESLAPWLRHPAGPAVQGRLQLSGGQRQRIAVARGVYRSAQLLIMDEPLQPLTGAPSAMALGGQYAELYTLQASQYNGARVSVRPASASRRP